MDHHHPTLTLGIETSCDETSVAVVRNHTEILSHVVWSQIDVHAKFGGVVPELASRAHIEKIGPLLDEALREAGCEVGDLHGMAVTRGPGLVGALLVGVQVAKGVASASDIPFIGVNHLESHLYSVLLEEDPPICPLIALIVSGGHTILAYVPEWGTYEVHGQTRDDAVGEAYDKVGKLLGLPYPGGPKIDRIASEFQGKAVSFPKAVMKDGSADFSFSGLKTAVLYHVKGLGRDPTEEERVSICAGFQRTAVDMLADGAMELCWQKGCQRLAVVGGVACNGELRRTLRRRGEKAGVKVYSPKPSLCTDNAAMIACLGSYRLQQGERSDLSMDVDPNLALGE